LGGCRGRLIDAPTRISTLILIREAVQSGARKKPACELIGLSVRTIERWEKETGEKDKRQSRRFIPSNKLTADECAAVLGVANHPDYAHLSPCQIVPRLADKGIYIAAESTFYRLLRAEKLLTHRGRSHAKHYTKPAELIATQSNQIWSWDISYLPTQICGLFYYLYFVMDIYSRKIVGWTVETTQSAEHAAELITQCYLSENIKPHQVKLHSDNGAPMKGATMLATLQTLGVMPSFSRPSVSDDNPYSEALFKTTKYCAFYPESKFETLDAAIAWVSQFVNWYNTEHRHSGIRFVTPEQRHMGLDIMVLAKRKQVYLEAKQKQPSRWARGIRNWQPIEEVVLNPATTITPIMPLMKAA
jgi:putative transposase